MSQLPSRQQHHPDHPPNNNYHHQQLQPYPINLPVALPHPLLQPAPLQASSSSSSSSSYHLQQHTTPELPPSTKPPKKSGSRSAVACNLCRAQKMKCEGPSCQPCKRCQRLKQPCVFGESQGRGRQIVWAKRTEELEARVSKLEEELSETKARVCRVEACVANLQTTSKQHPRKRKPSADTPVQDEPQPSQSARTSMVEGPPTSKAIQAAQFGPRRSDLIERGMLSPEMARRLFEIHQTRWAPQIPWLNIPDTFENVRWHSPLMLAVACSAGAKGDGDVDTYQKMKAHAIELIIDVVFYRVFAHDRPQSYQDLIAVIGCIIHCGLYIDPVLVVDHAEYLRLRDVFDRIPEPRWQSEFDQRQLLSVARTFIGVYIHSVLYSTLTGKPCVMRIKKSILISYCSIICNSPYSAPEWDGNLVYFVKYYAIMQEAQEHLDSHYRLGSIKISERLAVVEKYAALVNHWKQDLDRTNHNLLPDAASEFKHLYHRAFAYLTCFVTQDLRTGKSLRANKQGLRFAKEGVAHALEVLKQFIDSRKAERGVPCVHLEYRKSTISIATACILEGCVLIPEHIDFDHCREIIKTFALEVEAEGGGWGIGTEDKYVTTLKVLLKDLDSRASPQSAITRQNELELDSIPEPGPPSVGTNEVPSSLPSPLEMTSSTGFPDPSSALENLELINDTASHGSMPQDTSQSGQLYGDGLSENTQLWANMINMPIRSETPPTSFISYAPSLPSLTHDRMEGLKMAWFEDQKSYNSLDYEPSVQVIEQGSKVGFPGEERPHVRVDGTSGCWKPESSQLSYPNSSSMSYPEEPRMDPETDGDRRQTFDQSPSIPVPSHLPHHYHQLPQDGTESASSFTHSNLSTFTLNQSHAQASHSFLIHHPHAPHQVPEETFDLIQSLRTVYPDRMVQTTFQKQS
ncbi:hypothetical protein PGT21_023138 [Puccinia graminis f. sp. tritici]|uniref:Zn(2)-C6 fungal-type domain-containing protein n=2 Tax=Puccinia graminis f. sp. tritici TaxID=56615 RepID=H6QP14_PUCGT|nr:uncharacterized protein PGTG_20715 [Puccinia graminis f. sp. tritici CRL 75-36-700-3]EHS63128.1 hypothetical protein PGTG_20715 [Puccinia graminis f. sp. tritici CRL 75-36-700-3]KAA1117784.1 hypothetical protein PGT21_023138 [Puccinia graminis f. sp. tritici]